MNCLLLPLLLFTSLLGAQVVSAQDPLPDKPVPAQDAQPDKPIPRGNFLTRPFYDKPVAVLAEVNAGTATWDDVATHVILDRGGNERNPLMRPFVHNSGTLAAETVGEVWLMAFVADRMKHSHHAVLRKTWWLPQAVDISAKVYGGINSAVLLGR